MDMNVQCAVRNCSEHSDEYEQTVLFQIPADPDINRRWLSAVNKEDEPDPDLFVCNRHFEDDCFESETELKPDAIPTLNLDLAMDSDELEQLLSQDVDMETETKLYKAFEHDHESYVKPGSKTIKRHVQVQATILPSASADLVKQIRRYRLRNRNLMTRINSEKSKRLIQTTSAERIKTSLKKLFPDLMANFIWHHYELYQQYIKSANETNEETVIEETIEKDGVSLD